MLVVWFNRDIGKDDLCPEMGHEEVISINTFSMTLQYRLYLRSIESSLAYPLAKVLKLLPW